MKRYKVLFCDLDGTLIDTITGKTFAQGMWDMKLKLDVLDKIKELAPEHLYIVTNQGGIGKFFTEEDFVKKLEYIEVSIRSYIKHPKLKEVDSMYCDSIDMNDPYRKPNPGMVNYFIDKIKTKYTKDDMLMIGDASGYESSFSDSDIKCAVAAGITYLDVGDFTKVSFF